MISKIHTHAETVALFEKARESDVIIQRGKAHEDEIFVSKFNPHHHLPTLPHPVVAEEDAREYKSRSPYGIKSLRDAVEATLKERGIRFKTKIGSKNEHVFVCGTSVNSTLLPNLFHVHHAQKGLFKQHDEVLICSPIYGLLPLSAHDSGLKIIDIPGQRQHNYKPQAAAIADALKQHPNARALMIVNPCNPTGAALTQDEVNAIAAVVARHNQGKNDDNKLIIVTDETFKNLLWPKKFKLNHFPADMKAHIPPELLGPEEARDAASFLSCPEIRDCTIAVNTFSKSYAPSIGFAYAIAHPDLIARMPTFDGPGLEAQQYAATILGSDPQNRSALHDYMEKSLRRYHAQYLILEDGMQVLNAKLKMKFGGGRDYVTLGPEPDAGFHVPVYFQGLKGLRMPRSIPQIGTIQSSLDLAAQLSGAAHVTAYPGEMFYMNGDDMMLRFSLNLDDSKMLEAMKRIEKFCLSLEQSKAAALKQGGRRSGTPAGFQGP